MMTLDEEIKFWEDQALKTEKEVWLIAYGICAGLKIAKREYGVSGKKENRG